MPSAYSVFKPKKNAQYSLYCVVWSDSDDILLRLSVIFEITSDTNNFNYTCIISYNTDTGTIQFVKKRSITFEEYAKNGVLVLMFEIDKKYNIIYEIGNPYRLWKLDVKVSDPENNIKSNPKVNLRTYTLEMKVNYIEKELIELKLLIHSPKNNYKTKKSDTITHIITHIIIYNITIIL